MTLLRNAAARKYVIICDPMIDITHSLVSLDECNRVATSGKAANIAILTKLNLGLFSHLKCIIDLYTQVANGAFQAGMTQQ